MIYDIKFLDRTVPDMVVVADTYDTYGTSVCFYNVTNRPSGQHDQFGAPRLVRRRENVATVAAFMSILVRPDSEGTDTGVVYDELDWNPE